MQPYLHIFSHFSVPTLVMGPKALQTVAFPSLV